MTDSRFFYVTWIRETWPGLNCRLVIRWRNEFKPELRKEGYSKLTLELEPPEDTVKLTLVRARR